MAVVFKIGKSIKKINNQVLRIEQELRYRLDNGTITNEVYQSRLGITKGAQEKYLGNIRKMSLYRKIEKDVEYYKRFKDDGRCASKRMEYTNMYYESLRRLNNTVWTPKQYTFNMALRNTRQYRRYMLDCREGTYKT